MILQDGRWTLLAPKGRQSRAADCCEPKAVDSIDIFAVVTEAAAVAADAVVAAADDDDDDDDAAAAADEGSSEA